MIDIIVIDTQQHYKQYQVLLDIANVKIWAATVFCFLVPVSISPSSLRDPILITSFCLSAIKISNLFLWKYYKKLRPSLLAYPWPTLIIFL